MYFLLYIWVFQTKLSKKGVVGGDKKSITSRLSLRTLITPSYRCDI